MSNPIFETDKYKNAELRAYSSITQLEAATGIPRPILRLAKKLCFAGFKNANQTVNWKLLKPELEKRYDELITQKLPEDISTIKIELAKRDLKLKDLQIRKLERNLLEPDDVKQLLVELATKNSIIIKTILDELPPRLAGKAEPDIKLAINEVLQKIFTSLQSEGEVDKLNGSKS